MKVVINTYNPSLLRTGHGKAPQSPGVLEAYKERVAEKFRSAGKHTEPRACAPGKLQPSDSKVDDRFKRNPSCGMQGSEVHHLSEVDVSNLPMNATAQKPASRSTQSTRSDYARIRTFSELHAAHKALPLWKRVALAFDLISIPELEAAEARLWAEYEEAVEAYRRTDGPSAQPDPTAGARRQPASHPLKWAELVHQVAQYSGPNPDVWIEDVRRKGPCRIDGKPEEPDTVGKDTNDETDCLPASFSVIHDNANNRIIIRVHY